MRPNYFKNSPPNFELLKLIAGSIPAWSTGLFVQERKPKAQRDWLQNLCPCEALCEGGHHFAPTAVGVSQCKQKLFSKSSPAIARLLFSFPH